MSPYIKNTSGMGSQPQGKRAGEKSARYPLLESINSPEDLRRLGVDSLPGVCLDIRRFLIDQLSTHPGHFASSMGAVELTVALHYVFNTPYDRIVWDVGHQAYGHKLLTGRRDVFNTNRTFNGISGFPTPEESEYDTFTAGHASNSISAALGMAVATRLDGDNPRRNVVAVIGDASIGGGLAFEGLNNAANSDNNLLIILNDNDMSIDSNTGSLNSYLAHLTASRGYNKIRYGIYRTLRAMRLVSDRGRGSILRFNNSLKSLLGGEQNIFEGLNIRYFGPFDGHDVGNLVRVLNDIKDMEGPRILHLKTVKGKGFAAAEKDPSIWHAPGKFNPATGELIKSSTGKPKYQDIFGDTVTQLAKDDHRIVAITAAMLSGTSVSKMQETFPDRTFDVGISEGHAVTFAGGLAKEGMRPYCAIYSSFLQRAYDHIIHDVSIQGLPVTFCIDRAGLVGEDGVTHHGLYDIVYLRSIPGMTIIAPRNGEYLRRALYTSSLRESGPMAIRYPRGNAESDRDTGWREELPVGRGELLRHGTDVAILTFGTVADDALKAAAILEGKGINAAVYDMIYVKPIDEEILTALGKSNIPIITVEDGTVTGGFGSAVSEWMSDNLCTNKIVRLGVPDKFIKQGTIAQLKQYCGFDTDGIVNAVVKLKGEQS